MSSGGSGLLFDARRLRVYPLVLVLLYLIYQAALLGISSQNVDRSGTPVGADFITFFAASKLTLAGEPEAAFEIKTIAAAERAVAPASKMVFQWAYPPTYQLLIAPLALMPYGVAFYLFIGLTWCAFAAALASLPQTAGYRIALLCSPPVFLCAIYGQNAMLTAALFAGGFALLVRRPFWAGVIFAGLAFKPQMALLLPVALIAGRQWRALLGAGIGTLVFAGAATAVFGMGLWLTFIHHLGTAQDYVRTGQLSWAKITSAFVFFRSLGVPEPVAYAAQLMTALVATVCVASAWRRGGPTPLAWAVLTCATLLVTPYVFLYEFVLLLIPIGLLAWDMSWRGACRVEKLALILSYGVAPILDGLAGVTHLQIGFPIVLMLLMLSMHRVQTLTQASRPVSALVPSF